MCKCVIILNVIFSCFTPEARSNTHYVVGWLVGARITRQKPIVCSRSWVVCICEVLHWRRMFVVGYWYNTCTGSYYGRLDASCSSYPFCISLLHVVAFRGDQIVLEPKIGRRTRFISFEVKERLHENREFSLQLHVMGAWFSERSAAYSGVPERQSSLQHGQVVLR